MLVIAFPCSLSQLQNISSRNKDRQTTPPLSRSPSVVAELGPLSRRPVCMVLPLRLYFYNFFRTIIFPRARLTRNCVSVVHTQQWDPKQHQNQTFQRSQRKMLPALPISLWLRHFSAKRSEAEPELGSITSGEQSCAGRVQTPAGPLGAGASTGGWGSKPEDFKTFREKTLLKFQPCSLCKTSGVGSCSQ